MGEERRIERLEFELAEAGTDILDLRKQLAEALADCDATSYKLSEAFDELVAYELQLAEANRKLAERINDDQKYLIAPLCNAEKALDDCQSELAEARAEIERLKQEHEKALVNAKNYMVELSAAYLAEDQSITELVAQKDKLIEQMRGALTKLIGTLEVMSVMPETLGKCPVLAIDAPELEQARAALLAAERGEG